MSTQSEPVMGSLCAAMSGIKSHRGGARYTVGIQTARVIVDDLLEGARYYRVAGRTNLGKFPQTGSILALGQTLDMSVVIEGMETDAKCQQLLTQGCTYGQGYWYARPMAGDDLMKWLQSPSYSAD